MSFILLLFSSTLWSVKDFYSVSFFSQKSYPVNIEKSRDKVIFKATPQEEGFASGWMFVEKIQGLTPNSFLKILLKGNGKKVRIRYFFWNYETGLYFSSTEYIKSTQNYGSFLFPFKRAQPFYSSNFPSSLVPSQFVEFFLFIENGEKGDFEIEIKQISIENPTGIQTQNNNSEKSKEMK